MILLLVGASEPAIGAVREAARSRSVDLRIGTSLSHPDWVMTSTGGQRQEAIRRYGLPAFRVIELGALGEDHDAPSEVVRTAIARMTEIGPLPRHRSRVAGAVAARTIPVLTEWASWLAADEARQTIAAHASFLRDKHGASFKAWILFVVPDVHAFTALSGLLNESCRERHMVHVAITNISPGDPDLSSLQGSYVGLTVGRAPERGRSPWRSLARAVRECLDAWHAESRIPSPESRSPGGASDLESAVRNASRLASALARNRVLRIQPLRAIAARALASIERALPPDLDLVSFLEERKPDVLVVVPHRSIESIEADYFRTARRLGVRSLCLPLRWDDLQRGTSLRYEEPDVVALWNEQQRRELIGAPGIPAHRLEVTGAVLPSDALESRTRIERDVYCERMEIDPARRIVLFEAPVVSTRASVERFKHWRGLLKQSEAPEVRRAAVVVYVHNPDDVPVWRRISSTDDIAVARSGVGEGKALARLNEALMASDVVMASGLTVALEAGARAKPVIVCPDAGTGDDSELERYCRGYAEGQGWPVVARSVQEAVARLSTILGPQTASTSEPSAAARGNDDTGSSRVYRLLATRSTIEPPNEVARRPALWWRLLIIWLAQLARRFDAAAGGQTAPPGEPQHRT